MEDLFSKTDERSGRSWSNVVKQIEDRYRMATESPRFNDPDYMTKYMQEEFARFAHRFTEESPGLGTVLSKIAEEISPLSNNEIDDAFRDLNLRAMVLARECATEWGGQHSVLRASAMSPARLNLDVLSSQIVPSPFCTWTDGQTIHVPTGVGPRPLLDFLCLKFFLLHEYLSHHFPVWEDGAGLLSEGYLFPVGRWWHTARAEFAITTSLVDIDWQHHWQHQAYPQSAQYWREFHSWVDWMESSLSETKALLDLARDGRIRRGSEQAPTRCIPGVFRDSHKEEGCRFCLGYY